MLNFTFMASYTPHAPKKLSTSDSIPVNIRWTPLYLAGIQTNYLFHDKGGADMGYAQYVVLYTDRDVTVFLLTGEHCTIRTFIICMAK
jgi:hypothetical protein